MDSLVSCLKEAKAKNQQLRKELDVVTKKIDNLERYSKRHNLIFNELLPFSYAKATALFSHQSPVCTEFSADTEKAFLQLVNETLNLLITPSEISVAHRLPSKSGLSTSSVSACPSVIVRFTNFGARDAVYLPSRC